MKEKYRSALGLSVIIFGVGISWMAIVYFVKPYAKNINFRVEKIVSEIEVTDINRSVKFYNMVLRNKSVDSLTVENPNSILQGNEINLIKSKNIFRSKLSLKINNLDAYKIYLENNNINFNIQDTTLTFYDPDSNKIIVK